VAADPTRRTVLAATAALPLLAAGCKGVGALAAPPQPAPDVALLRDVIAAEELMIARYQAAIRIAPGTGASAGSAGTAAGSAGAAAGDGTGMAVVLRSLLSQHQAHLARLSARLIVPVGSRYPPALSHRRTPAPRLPSVPHQLAAHLAAAERAASGRLARQLLAAPPSLAQLLASISASEATHVPVLRTAGRIG